MMRLLKFILASAMVIAVGSTQADTIGVHTVSYHLSSEKYNNVNLGMYWRSDSGLTLGGYRNSYKHNSLYAGWTFENENKQFAVTVGAVSGYTKTVHRTRDEYNGYFTRHYSWVEQKKIINPLLAFSYKPTENIRLMFIPDAKPNLVSLVHISFETKL